MPPFVTAPAFKDETMKGTPAIYLGRIVPKENFRAFIYAMDGSKRLVESWDEFEANMQSGLWFATAEDAKARIPVAEEKPKAARARKPKKEGGALEVEPKQPVLAVEDMPKHDHGVFENRGDTFEVTDDFLPN